jgi:hypothetical protein
MPIFVLRTRGIGETMEKSECILEGEQYPDGREVCMDDRCMRCSDGKWEPDEFEIGYRY